MENMLIKDRLDYSSHTLPRNLSSGCKIYASPTMPLLEAMSSSTKNQPNLSESPFYSDVASTSEGKEKVS